MELSLNIVWLLIALVSLGLWWSEWSHALWRRKFRRVCLRSAVGLVCALMLLFFAVSLTDDLQAVPALAEDLRSTRRVVQIWKGSQSDPDPEKHVAPFDDGVRLALFSPTGVVVRQLVSEETISSQPGHNRPPQGRAPPGFASLAL